MRVERSFVYLVALFVALVGCSGASVPEEDSGTPGRRHYLTEAQVASNEQMAKSGDSRAVTRLINHYQWAVLDRGKAEFWLRKGADLGDHYAMMNLASQLAAVGDESNCKAAELLLVRVLNSSPAREVHEIASTDLQTLRNGAGGTGYCVDWLRTKGDAEKGVRFI